MNRSKIFCIAAVMAISATLVLSLPAAADTIGPSCGTCQGSIYTLTYDPTKTTTSGGNTTYQVSLSVNANGFNPGSGTGPFYIGAVAVKVSSSVVPPAPIVTAPGGTTNWMADAGGLNSGGCDGAGSGFVCAQANASTTPHNVVTATKTTNSSSASPFVWTFNITIPTGTFFGTSTQSSIKAQYVDGTGTKVGALLSEDLFISTSTSTVPEPGSLMLLSSGALGMTGFIRRKLVKL